MLLVLGPRGKPPATPKCIRCDKIDPFNAPEVKGWTESKSLEPPTGRDSPRKQAGHFRSR
jgi:hypothetical protein